MRAHRIIVVFLASLLSEATAAQRQPPSATPGWISPYRHFNFSGIVFDLDYGDWSYPIQAEPIRDCSTPDMHCLVSRTFSVAVPRRCADLPAGHWSAGDVRTEILLRHTASSPPLHGGGSQTRLYLTTAGRPNVLYVYDPHLGIDAFYWDPGGRLDFVAMARDGRLEDWLFNEANRPAWQGRFFSRRSPQAIGACEG